MGLLSGFLGDGSPDWLNSTGNFLSNNSSGLLGLSAGLLSGQGWNQGLSQGVQGFAQGNLMDKKKQQDAKRQKTMDDLLSSTGGSMTPQMKAAIAANPDLAQGWVAQQLKPADYTYQRGADGNLYAINTANPNDTKQVGANGQFASGSDTQTRYKNGQAMGLKGNDLIRYSLTGAYDNPDQTATLAPGATLINKQTGATIAQAPKDTPTTLTEIYDDQGRTQKGYMQNGQFVPVGNAKATSVTADQSKAAGFADRASASDAVISKLGADVGTSRLHAASQAFSGLPIIGTGGQSPESQQYEQAKRDFINAVLRNESGAVIGPDEFASADKQYFPQPGEGEAVIAQKARNRAITIEALRRQAGGATIGNDGNSNSKLSDPLGIR